MRICTRASEHREAPEVPTAGLNGNPPKPAAQDFNIYRQLQPLNSEPKVLALNSGHPLESHAGISWPFGGDGVLSMGTSVWRPAWQEERGGRCAVSTYTCANMCMHVCIYIYMYIYMHILCFQCNDIYIYIYLYRETI